MEKPTFFYKENPQGQRGTLQDKYLNALLGDVKVNSLPQTRQIKIK